MVSRMNEGEHGRCEAIAKPTGEHCGRPAVGSNGKGDKHGENSLRERDHPSFKCGLFSGYLDEEDPRVIDAHEKYDDADKLDELINRRLARLRRAVQALNDQAYLRTFWDAFAETVQKAGSVEAEEIGELANMHARGNHEEVDRIVGCEETVFASTTKGLFSLDPTACEERWLVEVDDIEWYCDVDDLVYLLRDGTVEQHREDQV